MPKLGGRFMVVADQKYFDLTGPQGIVGVQGFDSIKTSVIQRITSLDDVMQIQMEGKEFVLTIQVLVKDWDKREGAPDNARS